MKRREVIKSTMLATGAVLSTSLVSFRPFEVATAVKERYAPIRLELGELEAYILSDGVVRLESVQPVFAPNVDKAELKKELKRLHLKEDKFEGSLNVLLIKNQGKTILLDTGAGSQMGENTGHLVKALNTLNISTADITDIIITHGHLDHIGGVLDKDNKTVFSSAQYHIAKREYDFWMSQDGTTGGSGVVLAQKVFNTIEDKLNFFDYGAILFSCLETELAAGHTKGHTVFNIFSGERSIKHIVDTFHSPFLISKPQWGTAWDTDFDQAVKTRQRIIDQGITQGTLFMSCHLPWPSLGYIDRLGDTAQWTIFPYTDPTRIKI